MKLISTAFQHGETIPQKYGRLFENINPPLKIEDVPEEAKSLVLIMDDPDIPEAAGVPVWDHWVVYNIEPKEVVAIVEGWEIKKSVLRAVQGSNTRGELEYGGPKPPDKEHRYFFKVYALDTLLDLAEGASKTEVEAAMEGHVIDSAELMGRFAPQEAE